MFVDRVHLVKLCHDVKTIHKIQLRIFHNGTFACDIAETKGKISQTFF